MSEQRKALSLNGDLLLTKGNLCLLLAAGCWGLSTPLSKMLLDDYEPMHLLLIQLSFSLVFLWSIIILRRRTYDLARAKILPVMVIGVLEPGLAYLLGLIGLYYTTAINTGFLQGMEPIFIVLISVPLLKRNLSLPAVGAMLVSFVGLNLLLDMNIGAATLNLSFGDSLVLAGVFSAAVYVVLSAKFLEDSSPLIVLGTQQLSSWMFVMVVVLAVDGLRILDGLDANLLFAGMIGIMQFSLSFLFYFIGLKSSHPFVAAISLNMIPIFALLGSLVLLSETIGLIGVAGGLLVVASAAYLSAREEA